MLQIGPTNYYSMINLVATVAPFRFNKVILVIYKGISSYQFGHRFLMLQEGASPRYLHSEDRRAVAVKPGQSGS
jgi:hypothetical protein